MKRISRWIDGRVRDGASGRTGSAFDPATGEQPAEVDPASVEEVDHAVAAASVAFAAWRVTSLTRRSQVMFHIRELVEANSKEIASLITVEHGNVLSDVLGEVARASRTSSSPAASGRC